MDDGPTGHAMTEIALALAMSFFCLLVLAMVSLGTSGTGALEPRRIEALATAPAGGSAEAMRPADRLVILHRGRFLDADRRPLDPATVAGDGRVVLAVDPGLQMAEILAARRRFAAGDMVVAPLDRAWLAALGTGGRR